MSALTNPKFYTHAAVAGGLALGSALALQQLYKVTKWYPRNEVFWFAIGATSYAANVLFVKPTGLFSR